MKPTNVNTLNNAQGLQLRWLLDRVIAFNSKHHVLTDLERNTIRRMFNEISAYVCS